MSCMIIFPGVGDNSRQRVLNALQFSQIGSGRAIQERVAIVQLGPGYSTSDSVGQTLRQTRAYMAKYPNVIISGLKVVHVTIKGQM
jgi:hypothetical protein